MWAILAKLLPSDHIGYIILLKKVVKASMRDSREDIVMDHNEAEGEGSSLDVAKATPRRARKKAQPRALEMHDEGDLEEPVNVSVFSI